MISSCSGVKDFSALTISWIVCRNSSAETAPARRGRAVMASSRPPNLRCAAATWVSVGVAELLEQGGDVGPEFLEGGALVGGEPGQLLGVAQGGEVGVLLPVSKRLLHQRAGLRGVLGQFGPRGQVGAQPVVGLLAQT